jgi:hypothetical protein
MVAPQRFVNYPLAREVAVEEKTHPEDKNPPMKGLLLYYVSSLYVAVAGSPLSGAGA